MVGADIIVELEQGERALKVALVTPAGERILYREIDLEHGIGPALRVAVLVTTAALAERRLDLSVGVTGTSTRAIAVSSTIAGGDPPPPWTFSVGGAVDVSSYRSPGTLQLGGEVGAELAVSRFFAGLKLSWIGDPGWSISAADPASPSRQLLAASANTYAGWVDLGAVLVSAGFLEAGLDLGAGLGLSHTSASAVAFIGTAAPFSHDETLLLLRAMVRMSASLTEEVGVRASGGVMVRSRDTIALPAGFANGSQPLDAGVIAPLFQIGVSWKLF
jgi:hypothetical protein